MIGKLAWRRYNRPFEKPLRVSGRNWEKREGIILRVEQTDGQVGFGEIAPVPWFPVESLAEAQAFLESLGEAIETSQVAGLADKLPCTAFALSCALNPSQEKPTVTSLATAGLLPAGKEAIEAAKQLLDLGYTTLKWKVAVNEAKSEWGVAESLLNCIRGRAQLRLDANGGLNAETLRGWVQVLESAPIDFFEQPLPVGREAEALEICGEGGLPIAFDESACTLSSLERLYACYPDAVYVLKPSQAGSPASLWAFLNDRPALKRVYSSAFESAIGLDAVWCIIAGDAHAAYASGLGTAAYFEDDGLGSHIQNGAEIERPLSGLDAMEALWNRL